MFSMPLIFFFNFMVLQNQLEKEKEEKVRKLEAQYENSLKSIGQGHKEAGEQVSIDDVILIIEILTVLFVRVKLGVKV